MSFAISVRDTDPTASSSCSTSSTADCTCSSFAVLQWLRMRPSAALYRTGKLFARAADNADVSARSSTLLCYRPTTQGGRHVSLLIVLHLFSSSSTALGSIGALC